MLAYGLGGRLAIAERVAIDLDYFEKSALVRVVFLGFGWCSRSHGGGLVDMGP